MTAEANKGESEASAPMTVTVKKRKACLLSLKLIVRADITESSLCFLFRRTFPTNPKLYTLQAESESQAGQAMARKKRTNYKPCCFAQGNGHTLHRTGHHIVTH